MKALCYFGSEVLVVCGLLLPYRYGGRWCFGAALAVQFWYYRHYAPPED